MTTQPLYRQIADDIRVRIAQGDLQPGEPLPGEHALAAQWSVARMTARAALLALEREGLVIPGRPRHVARHQPLAVNVARLADLTWGGEGATLGADAWVGDMARAGQDIRQEIEVITELAGPEVARRLRVAADDTVTSRRLLRYAGGKPHNMIIFWFPQDVADGTLLTQPGSISEGSVAWLEKMMHGPMEHEVEVSARMPTPAEITKLDVVPGVPVLTVWRVSRGPKPLMCSLAIYPTDRASLRLVL